MTAIPPPPAIENLLTEGLWEAARQRIEQELAHDPDNHWLRTQLAVTFYEQRRYDEALRHLVASNALVSDCPLTLWNLAGTLDALGRSELAIPIYGWILGSDQTADSDSCWESDEWTDSLKTDCIFRLGICYRKQNEAAKAGRCFRQYVELFLDGVQGSYPIGDAADELLKLDQLPEPHGSEVKRASRNIRPRRKLPTLRALARLTP